MTEGSPPEAVWVFPEEKSRRGRVWLWILLTLATLTVVAVMVLFLLPRDQSPDTAPTSGPSATPTPHRTSSPTPTRTPTSTPTPPTVAPVTTEPEIAEPDIAVFRDRVLPVLEESATGLGFLSDPEETDPLAVVDQLRDDAQRLSESVPPAAIAAQWHEGVHNYRTSLDRLRDSIASGSGSYGDALERTRQDQHALSAMLSA